MYSAMNMAKYTVNYSMQKGSPISNLKLQKMLYYMWIDYYGATGNELFTDNFCAWQLGPVVPSIYYLFCSYAGTPIKKAFDVCIEDSDIPLINKIIDKYLPISASSLVEHSHHSGGPWALTYENGKGNRSIIPFTLIKSLECSR